MTEIQQSVFTLRKKIHQIESQAYQLRDLYMDLLDKEKLFRGMAEHSPQGILVTKDMHAVFANRSFAKIFGFDDPQEIVSLGSVEGLFSDQGLCFIESNFASPVPGDETACCYECAGHRRDGSVVWLEGTSFPSQWGSNAVIVSTLMPIQPPGRMDN